MDKLEYIPGDFISVYVGVKKYIVEVIGTENENEALLYQIKFPNGEIQYADKDNIVPIPLTPEILEKNGWKKVSDYNYIHQSRKFRIVSRDRETYKWSIVVGGFGLGEYIGYVSELQHFLFGIRLKRGMEV